MDCEVIAVGTELLLGQIVDTNSSWIGEQLALAGIDSHHQTKVGDNWSRIEEALQLGIERSDAIIVCGGLGPTQDDITREVIADVVKSDLVLDDVIAERIRGMFRSRGRDMPENNLRQAMVPEGAQTMEQQPGTAPGLVVPVPVSDGDDKVIYAVPGVPYEMKEMILGTVLPDLQRRSGVTSVIESRVLRTWGQSESGLAELLSHRITELETAGNPTLAFLASGVEGIKVRVTAKAATSDEAEEILRQEEDVLRGLLGDLIFAVDEDNMESTVLTLLATEGLTLGAVETTTGGYLAHRLATARNGTEAFSGGVVARGPGILSYLLKGDPAAWQPDEAAMQMARVARGILLSDVGVATTAIEDPGRATDAQPFGTAWLAVSMEGFETVERVTLPGDLERIRQFSVISLLNLLRLHLQGLRP
ncbi:MAG: CinA family nicotinamide mononucleotide deamidase-related protein [Acidimicrobiales bacterium]|nr:CinA family nicotinamide mononucleotide deamidase-related protein [Acidimicrobiales bacterium]